jgi:hypothetical protein
VFVDLVGDHQQVPLDRQLGDGGELLAAQHGAGGVVRSVEQDEPGARGDGGPQLVEVQPEGVAVRAERDRDPAAARHGDAGGVRVVGLIVMGAILRPISGLAQLRPTPLSSRSAHPRRAVAVKAE